ncbi:hypothetical protein HN011_001632, partial [Eciton burchellii]
YRSDDYQWRHAYNNAGSSQMRGSWNPGFGLPRSYPVPQEYQQRRNHYGSHQLQSRNISYYQGAQQGYPNQRNYSVRGRVEEHHRNRWQR